MKLRWWVALVMVGGAVVAGWSARGASTPTSALTPAESAASPASTTAAAPPPEGRIKIPELGSDGLTVRYRNADGTVSRLEVEDFRR